MKIKKLIVHMVILISLLFSGVAWAEDQVKVLASFSILQDLVQEVGGEYVQVDALVGYNQDSHVFQPTPTDIKKLAQADLFVVNGLGFEGWMSRLVESAGFKGKVMKASQGIALLAANNHGDEQHDHAGHEHDEQDRHHHHGDFDPHAWQDPQRVQQYVKNIAAALIQASPTHQAYFEQRANAYIQQLQELDQWASTAFNQIATEQRVMITSHNAFAYMGDRYQLKILSAQSISTDSEPSAKAVAALIQQIKQEKVKAVFLENFSNQQLIQQIATEAGVIVTGKLYSDALSTEVPSYLAMYRHNVSEVIAGMK